MAGEEREERQEREEEESGVDDGRNLD